MHLLSDKQKNAHIYFNNLIFNHLILRFLVKKNFKKNVKKTFLSIPGYCFSFREGAAVTPAALKRLVVEEVMKEVTRLRPWCTARSWGRASHAGPSALAQRRSPLNRRQKCKHTNHICAHLTAALVCKSTQGSFKKEKKCVLI